MAKKSKRDIRFEPAFPVGAQHGASGLGMSKLLLVSAAVYSNQRVKNAKKAIELAEILLGEVAEKVSKES